MFQDPGGQLFAGSRKPEFSQTLLNKTLRQRSIKTAKRQDSPKGVKTRLQQVSGGRSSAPLRQHDHIHNHKCNQERE